MSIKLTSVSQSIRQCLHLTLGSNTREEICNSRVIRFTFLLHRQHKSVASCTGINDIGQLDEGAGHDPKHFRERVIMQFPSSALPL